MPRLGRISDPVELDNLYSDKVIVYVEGVADLAFFNDLLGPAMADRLEFKVPEEKGSGYLAVKARVAMERAANDKIHGLLDGDAAVAFDRFETFLEGGDVMFRVTGEDLEGLMFLSEYELENIVLCHADLPDFLAAHVPFAAIGTRSPEALEGELLTLARRFYLLSILKFAAGTFHRAGRPCSAVDRHEGLFDMRRRGVAQILRSIRPKVVEAGIPWADFVAATRRFARAVTDHFDRLEFDGLTRRRHVLRMADGKNLLKRVRGDYNGTPHWEGQLHGRLKERGYAARFRAALERETGCNDNH